KRPDGWKARGPSLGRGGRDRNGRRRRRRHELLNHIRLYDELKITQATAGSDKENQNGEENDAAFHIVLSRPKGALGVARRSDYIGQTTESNKWFQAL
ncbi:MAG TPA: hypothetical protein VKE72_03225, partial [Methylocella sp.]|nr:hypothetical protein [Methylocella sp.]